MTEEEIKKFFKFVGLPCGPQCERCTTEYAFEYLDGPDGTSFAFSKVTGSKVIPDVQKTMMLACIQLNSEYPFSYLCESCGSSIQSGIEPSSEVLEKVRVFKQTLREQVSEFHRLGEHLIAKSPSIPNQETILLRAALVAEEAFELLDALLPGQTGLQGRLSKAKANLDLLFSEIRDGFVRQTEPPNLIELADACADLDYVVEGTRLTFGINGKPIADAVHLANLAKFGPGSYKKPNGKIGKPPDWKPPDIEAELIKQGWVKVS